MMLINMRGPIPRRITFGGVRMNYLLATAYRRATHLCALRIAKFICTDQSAGIHLGFPVEIINEEFQCLAYEKPHGIVRSISNYFTSLVHNGRINFSNCSSIVSHFVNSFSSSIYGVMAAYVNVSARNCPPQWLTLVNTSDTINGVQ